MRQRRRLLNYGQGDLFNFHGAYTEKADAVKKEQSIPGAFIRDVWYKTGPRYGVLTKNPRAKKRNVEWGTYEKGVFHPWTRRPKTRKKRAVRRLQRRRNKPLTAHDARELGFAAFRKGLKRVPVHDPALMRRLEPGPVGTNLRTFKAWLHGWDQGNLVKNERRRNLGPVAALAGLANLKSLGLFRKKRRKGKRRNADDTRFVRQALAKLFPGKTAGQLSVKQLSELMRAAQELKAGKSITRGNPSRRNYADATDLYTQFHGRGPRQVRDTNLPIVDYDGHEELGQIGKMVSLTIGGRGWRKKIEWGPREAPDLASEKDGKQLYLVGGSQNLDSGLEALPVKTDRRTVDCGFAYQVEYFTQKGFDNFQPVTYYHQFGEDTGERPRVVYDRQKKRIHLVGGAYKVKPEGIVN